MSQVVWKPEEWDTMMPRVVELVDSGMSLVRAYDKAQLALPKARRRHIESIRHQCKGGLGTQALERWRVRYPNGAPSPKREPAKSLVVASPPGPAPRKPKPKGEPTVRGYGPETVTATGVRWVTREWAMLDVGVEHAQSMGDERTVSRLIYEVQFYVLESDRWRPISGLQAGIAKLPRFLAEGRLHRWEIDEPTLTMLRARVEAQVRTDVISLESTPPMPPAAPVAPPAAESAPAPQAEPAEPSPTPAAPETPEPAAAPAPTPAPISAASFVPFPISSESRLAAAFASIMGRATHELLGAYNAHVTAIIDERVGELAASITAQVTRGLAATLAEGMRQSVHEILAVELGGPVSTPEALAAPTPAPAPQSAPVAPPAPPVEAPAPAGPVFTLGEPVHDPELDAAMAASVAEFQGKRDDHHGPRIKVDIVGVDGKAAGVILRKLNGTFEARFVAPNDPNWIPRENVIVASGLSGEFHWPTVRDKIKRAGARYFMANGGVGSVVHQLDVLRADRLTG